MTTNTTPTWHKVSPATTLRLMVTIATAQHRLATAYSGAEGQQNTIRDIADDASALLESATLHAWNFTALSADANQPGRTTTQINMSRENAHNARIDANVSLNNARKLIAKLERLGRKAVRS